jgi:membrane-associated phospholipid phosphatase
MAFALTTSLAVAERRLHPGSPRAKIILGVGLAISSFIALARVESGYHFITDVIGGAVVGSSLGLLIPSMHNSPVHVVPVPNDNGAGVGLQGTF